MTGYPRDLLGYGRDTPDPQWPGGARIAVQIVINYEEGGENSILHGDPESEAFLSESVGAVPWKGMRNPNMESMYEFGARAGFWRLWRLLKDMPVTVFGVATALERGPQQVAAMLEAGWEIASHGLKWIDYKDMPEAEERAQIAAAVAIHRRVTGSPPLGWYTGRVSPNTLSLVQEVDGLLYSADSYADELPYWVATPTGGHHLIVPYTLDVNDFRFAMPQGFNSGEQFFAYLKDSFDTLYQEGVEGRAKLLSIGLHCRLSGRPGRTRALRRFLAYAQGHERVWWATRADVARHWRSRFPAS